MFNSLFGNKKAKQQQLRKKMVEEAEMAAKAQAAKAKAEAAEARKRELAEIQQNNRKALILIDQLKINTEKSLKQFIANAYQQQFYDIPTFKVDDIVVHRSKSFYRSKISQRFSKHYELGVVVEEPRLVPERNEFYMKVKLLDSNKIIDKPCDEFDYDVDIQNITRQIILDKIDSVETVDSKFLSQLNSILLKYTFCNGKSDVNKDEYIEKFIDFLVTTLINTDDKESIDIIIIMLEKLLYYCSSIDILKSYIRSKLEEQNIHLNKMIKKYNKNSTKQQVKPKKDTNLKVGDYVSYSDKIGKIQGYKSVYFPYQKEVRTTFESLINIEPPEFFKKLEQIDESIHKIKPNKFKVGDKVTITYPDNITMKGTIIDIPEDGTLVNDHHYNDYSFDWMLDDQYYNDIPRSGSVWFFSDMDRRYFVLLENGNIDLHSEGDIKKRKSIIFRHMTDFAT